MSTAIINAYKAVLFTVILIKTLSRPGRDSNLNYLRYTLMPAFLLGRSFFKMLIVGIAKIFVRIPIP